MRQLALELTAPPAPEFGNFVPGRNGELLAALRALSGGERAERFVYLWGGAGSGRSHLLRAAVAARGSREGGACYAAAPLDAAVLEQAGADTLLAIDDVDRLDRAGEIALFGLYNRMRESSGALIASGATVPAGLGLRAEVATRLAWGLVYEVHALSDDEKARAMHARAQARGYVLPDDVRDYVLTHGRRDLPYLLAVVDLIDRRSLENRRAVTLPLVRDLLRAGVVQEGRP